VTLSRFPALRVNGLMDRGLELQLVGRLRTGDSAAFDAVYEAFNGRLYSFLARLSNSRDIAEDLTEETWLRLVVHARRLQPDTRLGAWLFTVARNLHASYCRSRNLEESHTAGLLGLWPSGSPGPTPLQAAEASEAQGRIASALASLPTRHREALLLVAVEGFTPAEAAAACGVSAEAMRQRLSRARALLARRLSDAAEPALTSLKEVTS
jgi:RNA polymerase sigma factor (sigma-70 family)